MPSAQWELAVRSEAASLNQIMYMILFLLERGGLIQDVWSSLLAGPWQVVPSGTPALPAITLT